MIAKQRQRLVSTPHNNRPHKSRSALRAVIAQGVKGVLATGVVGGLFTLVVLISGSLLPAIALHALTDIGTGLVAWLALRKVQGAGDLITGLSESA
jgi:membrane protease YdiL (CAAX protease family)